MSNFISGIVCGLVMVAPAVIIVVLQSGAL
jgi:hypothetical protein